MARLKTLLIIIFAIPYLIYPMFEISGNYGDTFINNSTGSIDLSFINNTGYAQQAIITLKNESFLKFDADSFTLTPNLEPNIDHKSIQEWIVTFSVGETKIASGTFSPDIVAKKPLLAQQTYTLSYDSIATEIQQTFLIVPDSALWPCTSQDIQLVFDGTFGGLPLTPSAIINQTNGTAMILSNKILFDPLPGFTGIGSFTYTALSRLDGSTLSIQISVNIGSNQDQ